ncbi:uncharacterized protein DSM5745_04811 [Aspergillus mulundensis]|uniref:Uncharacterized protein n=1 Tax=Aspergillus mulundensis TaxID=1810919 RepID=A0A3D8S5G3_9EURO|nr:Uncharacterized protein DSM5745_04811 [Aspergillus mulundensis]RDW81254.1 Uncharacterized protein DSM5745_04811 [Aspergillus mulundensis]
MTSSTDPNSAKPKQTPLQAQTQPLMAAEKQSQLSDSDQDQEAKTLSVSVQEKSSSSSLDCDPIVTEDLDVQQPAPEEYDPSVGAKPYSPFYRHATPSCKLARLASQRRRSHSVRGVGSPIDDIEGQRPPWHRLYDVEEGREETGSSKTKLKLWAKKKKYCDCLGGLSARQRMAVKIAVAVVLVGGMVAVALGITAAVGGGVWRGENRTEKLG